MKQTRAITSFTILPKHLDVNFCATRLRKKMLAPASFRVPFYPVIPLLGLIRCLILIFSLPMDSWIVATVAIYCSNAYFGLCSKMKIDAVIAVKNEAFKLNTCCTELLKKVPINNLIIVVGSSKDNTLETANKYANIIIEDENKGIGYARSLGLEKVETDYYASIDSDVFISGSWYSWCIRTIEKPKVGACEGFLWPIGTNFQKVLTMWSKGWSKDFSTNIIDEKGPCSLGNTMLRTDIVREVGMPFDRSCEDIALRKKLASKGYGWVVNYNLLSTHAVSDIDVLLHTLHWSKLRKRDGNFFKQLAVILKLFFDSRKEQDLNLSIYLLLHNLAESYGLLVKR